MVGPYQAIVCQYLMQRNVSRTQSFTSNLCHFCHIHTTIYTIICLQFFPRSIHFKTKQNEVKEPIISNNIFDIMGLMYQLYFISKACYNICVTIIIKNVGCCSTLNPTLIPLEGHIPHFRKYRHGRKNMILAAVKTRI